MPQEEDRLWTNAEKLNFCFTSRFELAIKTLIGWLKQEPYPLSTWHCAHLNLLNYLLVNQIRCLNVGLRIINLVYNLYIYKEFKEEGLYAKCWIRNKAYFTVSYNVVLANNLCNLLYCLVSSRPRSDSTLHSLPFKLQNIYEYPYILINNIFLFTLFF